MKAKGDSVASIERANEEMAIAAPVNARQWVQCFLSLGVIFLMQRQMNRCVNPFIEAMAPGVSVVGMGATLVAFLALAIAVTYKPDIRRPQKLLALILVLYGVGLSMTAVALFAGNASLLFGAIMLMQMGSAAMRVMACLPLMNLSSAGCALCAASASLALSVLWPILDACGLLVNLCLYAGGTITLFFLCRHPAAELMQSTRASIPLVDLSLTEPRSFLPFSHIFFITLFIFNAGCGYSVSFVPAQESALGTAVRVLPVLAIAIWILARKCVPIDAIYQLACMLLFFGIVATFVPMFASAELPNASIASGSHVFRVIEYTALAAVCRRNPLNALFIFAWGQFALSAGTLLGWFLGALAYGSLAIPGSAEFVNAMTLIALFGFNLIFFKEASFEGTIQEIVAVPEVEKPDESIAKESDRFMGQCSKASETYSLTERESKILELLARGRNVPYIQEELVISHSTVRTHVRHIYEKMGVHSQQDLISIVEAQ